MCSMKNGVKLKNPLEDPTANYYEVVMWALEIGNEALIRALLNPRMQDKYQAMELAKEEGYGDIVKCIMSKFK